MSDRADAVIEARDLARHFFEGGRRLEVLRGMSFTIADGERVAVVGASGSGNPTVLQLLGGLDEPTSGEVRIVGQSLRGMGDAARGRLRNRSLGFVYQFHHLLPEFSALENAAMPLLVRGDSAASASAAAAELLEKVGLGERLSHRPGQLSGGERQRTAIARALITRPAAVLADEPTGNLDRATGGRVLEVLLRCNSDFGTSLVVVTHDMDIAARMDRVLVLEDGQLKQA